jgi:hypothetical protein
MMAGYWGVLARNELPGFIGVQPKVARNVHAWLMGAKAPPPGLNVAFASGDYYYLVGEEVPELTAGTERTLVAAARHLHDRTKS